jgi:hypothetical protein
MIYKGQNVEFIQLVSYMGEEHKNKTFKENQKFFMEKISGKLSFSCTFECPIEDMICINHRNTPGIGDTEEDRKALLCGLEELKKFFPDSYINLNLDGFIENEGNSIDLTGEEFNSLHC